MNVFLSVPVASFKEDSSLLTHTDASLSSLLHTWSCLFLSSFEHCALSANFIEGRVDFVVRRKETERQMSSFHLPHWCSVLHSKKQPLLTDKVFPQSPFSWSDASCHYFVRELLSYILHITVWSTSLFFPQCRWERWRNGTVQLIQSMNMGNML